MLTEEHLIVAPNSLTRISLPIHLLLLSFHSLYLTLPNIFRYTVIKSYLIGASFFFLRCVHVCLSSFLFVSTHGSLERSSDPLELELQVFVSHLIFIVIILFLYHCYVLCIWAYGCHITSGKVREELEGVSSSLLKVGSRDPVSWSGLGGKCLPHRVILLIYMLRNLTSYSFSMTV